MAKKEAVDACKDEKLKFELDMEYQRKSALLAKQNEAYKQYCADNDLKPLSDRLQIAKWDRKQAAAARGAAQRYENCQVKVPTIASRKSTSYNKVRTAREFEGVANAFKEGLGSYAKNPSKWSGRVLIDNSIRVKGANGQKEWNCDITLVDNASDGDVLHELLHSCSVSYYTPIEYLNNQSIEEASVEFLKIQILKANKLSDIDAYPELVEILEFVNSTFDYGTDMNFAIELFNIPMLQRYEWLEDRVMESLRILNASFEDFNDVMLYLDNLKGPLKK